VVDPTIEAARKVLDESVEEIRRGIAGLTIDQLNATPAGGDTNPIAVIATHALASTLSWLSLAMGAPLPDRDRPAEFRAVADDGFVDRTEDAIRRCLTVLDASEWDAARVGIPNWTAGGPDEPRTAAYALSHALAHLGEHVGHLHMTRELLR
jgi:hypothetical protein